MDWSTTDADLARIDTGDATYRITTNRNIEPLAASIGVTGLLNAPFVIAKQGGNYTVVAGFRRVEACRRLKMQQIPVRCFGTDAGPEGLAEIAVADNSSQRPLNLIESSRALHLLHTHIHDQQQLMKVSGRLGLPTKPAIADKVARICHMAFPIQDGIINEVINLKVALELDSFENDAGSMLAALFVRLHCSQSKQIEILTNVKEIAARDDIAASVLLHDPQLQAMLSDLETDRNQKLRQFRNHFKARRYPWLTLAENRFHEASKALSLGPNIRFQAPAGFESREYHFQLRVHDVAGMRKCVDILKKTLHNPSLKKIFS